MARDDRGILGDIVDREDHRRETPNLGYREPVLQSRMPEQVEFERYR